MAEGRGSHVRFYFPGNMPEPVTSEEAKVFLELCRAGKLYEIER
jgi:hypothetical protein